MHVVERQSSVLGATTEATRAQPFMRGRLSGVIARFVGEPTVHHRHRDIDFGDLGRLDLKGVAVEYDDVGIFSDL